MANATVTTAADVAYQTLRQQILAGELVAGQRIDQDAEARRLEISRMPIREALRRLEAEGLVEITRHRGAHVRPMSISDLCEMYVIRLALEPLAARLGGERVTSDALTNMDSLIPQMETIVQRVDATAWLNIDWQFHSLLYAEAQHPRLLRLIQGLWEEVGRYRRLTLAFREELEVSLREHCELVEACKSQDGTRAEHIVRTALERSQRTLPNVLRETGLAQDALPAP